MRSRKPFGVVSNIGTKDPVPFAMIGLHDKETRTRKSFVISNVLGRYYLLTDNGNYLAKISGRKRDERYVSKEVDVKINKGILKNDYRL